MFRRIASIAAPTVRSSPSLIRALPVTNAAILGLLQSVNQLAGVKTKPSSSKTAVAKKKSTTTAAEKSNETPTLSSKKKKSTKVTKKVTIGSTKKKIVNKKKSITKKLSIKNKKKTIAKKVAKKKVTSSTKKKTVSKSKVSPAKKKKASATTKKKFLTTLKKKKQQKKVTSKKSKTGSKKKILTKKSNKKASSKKKIRASPKSNALVASSSSMSKAILIVQLDKERASRERVQRRLEKITMKYRELLAELASIREIANNLVLENAKRQEALPPPVASTPPPLPTPTPTLPAAEEPVAPAAPPSSFEEVLTHSTGILETKPPAVSQQDVVEEKPVVDETVLEDAQEEPLPGQQQQSNELVEKQEEEEVLAVNPSSALAPSVDVESALLQGGEVRAGEEPSNIEDNKATEVEKVPEKQEKKANSWWRRYDELEIDFSLPPPAQKESDPFQQFRAEVWNDEKLLEQKMKDYDSWNCTSAKRYSDNPEKAKHFAKRHAIWRLWQEEVEKKKTVVEDQTPKAEPAAEKKPSSKEKPAKEPRASKRAKQESAKPELTSSETSSVTYSDPNDLLTTGSGAAQPYEEPPVVSPAASAYTTDSEENNKKKKKEPSVAAATATNKVVDRKVRAEFKKFAQKIWRSKELDAKVKDIDALNSWFVKKLPKDEGMGGKLFHAKLFAATQMWKDLKKKKKSGDSVLSVDQCKTLVLEAMNEELSE